MQQGSRTGAWLAVVAAAAMVSGHGPAWAEDAPPTEDTAAPAELSDYDRMEGALEKLGRGITNLVTCPGEIIRTFDQVGHRDGYLAASSVGLLQGLGRTVLRAGAGVLEVATFPFKNNAEGYGPIMQPEYVYAHGAWQDTK